MYKKRLLFFVLVLSVFCVFAQDNYYVSKQGSDLNTGSVSSPFETISKALNSFGASGGNCFIMEGTYHENIIINGKNNIDMPIDNFTIKGNHNLKNAMAAATVANLLKIRKETIRKSLEHFQGIEQFYKVLKPLFINMLILDPF